MAGSESVFESWGMLHNKEEFQASAISQGRDVAALSLPRLF